MDNFLNRYHLPIKLNQVWINRPITHKEIEVVTKSFPTKKCPRLNTFTAEFGQTFKEELTPILFRVFHEIETEGERNVTV